MLRQQDVETEEERLRRIAAELPQEQRGAFYREATRELRDPDTYAALNWFFLVGLHHFYLRRWFRGAVNLGVFLVGVGLLFAQQFLAGIALIVLISLAELWALFRSQVIVQDWNNRVYRRLLKRHGAPP